MKIINWRVNEASENYQGVPIQAGAVYVYIYTSEGKKICSKYRRGHRNGGMLPMSLLVNLVSSSGGNDIGVGLT